MTPLEILERKDGAWASVPNKDRLWTVFHPGVLSDRIFRKFAYMTALKGVETLRLRGHEPSERMSFLLEKVRELNSIPPKEVERFICDVRSPLHDYEVVEKEGAASGLYVRWAVENAALEVEPYRAAKGAAVVMWCASDDCSIEAADQVQDLIDLIKGEEQPDGRV
jgi:hypothetical protein